MAEPVHALRAPCSVLRKAVEALNGKPVPLCLPMNMPQTLANTIGEVKLAFGPHGLEGDVRLFRTPKGIDAQRVFPNASLSIAGEGKRDDSGVIIEMKILHVDFIAHRTASKQGAI